MPITMKAITCGSVDAVAREIIRIPAYKAFGIIEWISLFQALSTCYALRKNSKGLYQQPFLSALFVFFVYCFGGSTLLAIFISSPAPWLASSRFVALYCGMFSLSFLYPFNLFFVALEKIHVVFDGLFAIVDAFGGAVSLTMHGIESVRSAPSLPFAKDSLFANVAGGFVYSYGGTLLCSMFSLKEYAWKFQVPPDFNHPSLAFKQSILVPFVYSYLLIIRNVPKETAAAVVVLLNLFLKIYFKTFGAYLSTFELRNVIKHQSLTFFVKKESKAADKSTSKNHIGPSTPRTTRTKNDFYEAAVKSESSPRASNSKASPVSRSKSSGMSLRDRASSNVSGRNDDL